MERSACDQGCFLGAVALPSPAASRRMLPLQGAEPSAGEQRPGRWRESRGHHLRPQEREVLAWKAPPGPWF